MPFLQLRITCDPSSNRTRHGVFLLLKKFSRVWLKAQDAEPETTCGYEQLNKFGEPTNPHYHLNIHFDVPDLKDPLRSAREWLRREAKSLEMNLKGNKVWSCTLVEEPTDFRRWIRYPLKESCIRDLTTATDEDELNELILEAKSERKRSIELNIIKREKAVDKQSLKDKLFKWLDDGEAHHTMPPSVRGPDAPDQPSQIC